MSTRFGTAFLALLALSLGARAVSLDPEGFGQALVFPYYTVQSQGTNAYNTFISIYNSTTDAKVLKVRFREGKSSLVVAEFNLYLAANDSWAAALIPRNGGTTLVTADQSCTDPPIDPSGLDFSNAALVAANDGGGTGLDRTMEGHFEAIEMGTLGARATNDITQNPIPSLFHCADVQGATAATSLQVFPPNGGLRGSATLLNVNTGLDMSYPALALANLTTVHFYTAPGKAGADFDSPQVTPVSNITYDGVDYRLTWGRGVDAVTSLFMTGWVQNDYVLDSGTASHTDWVAAFPTRRFYVTTTSAQPPFGKCAVTSGMFTDRYGTMVSVSPNGLPGTGVNTPELCWSAGAISVRNSPSASPVSDVLASRAGSASGWNAWYVTSTFQNGQISLAMSDPPGQITSLSSSTATSHATGAITQGPVTLTGSPVVGFMVRTFENGNLSCGTAVCQGNYSGSFANRYMRVFQ